jgi:5'-methylthioadenosine phosphorylase
MKIGIISGQRILNLLKNPEQIQVETPYGQIRVQVKDYHEHTLFFIFRHGAHGNLPPHKVSYHANIQAFASSHVDCLFSIGTVGSMKTTIKTGDLVIPHDFIDYTKNRLQTYFDTQRIHVDMTQPFCSHLREILTMTAKEQKQQGFHDTGVYLATEGPRLETAAEIQLFSTFADIVGMTLVPEVVLAREKGICYASICLVCNMAAGLQSRLQADEIASIYQKKEAMIIDILSETINRVQENRTCMCQVDLSKARL